MVQQKILIMKQSEQSLTDLYIKYKEAYLNHDEYDYIRGYFRGKMMAYKKALEIIKHTEATDNELLLKWKAT